MVPMAISGRALIPVPFGARSLQQNRDLKKGLRSSIQYIIIIKSNAKSSTYYVFLEGLQPPVASRAQNLAWAVVHKGHNGGATSP